MSGARQPSAVQGWEALPGRWHVLRAGGILTLTRRLPPRLDFAAEALLPACRSRLWRAQAVRRDLWRALRNVRGFSPVVTVADRGGQHWVQAGGRVAGTGFPKALAERRAAEVLAALGGVVAGS